MIKAIQDFPNYVISDDGVIINTKNRRKKVGTLGKNGYFYVTLYNNNMPKKLYIHRLVCLCFLPNSDNKRTVNHKDGDKLNNKLSNLEWATDAENIKHAYDSGLNRGRSKVTEFHLKEIYSRFFSGETLTAISKDLPYNNVTVSNHFTKYIISIGEQKKRAIQEKENKLNRAKSAGFHKRNQINLNMICKSTRRVLKVFSSITEAVGYLKVKSSGPISNVLTGRQKTAYGYFWKC